MTDRIGEILNEVRSGLPEGAIEGTNEELKSKLEERSKHDRFLAIVMNLMQDNTRVEEDITRVMEELRMTPQEKISFAMLLEQAFMDFRAGNGLRSVVFFFMVGHSIGRMPERTPEEQQAAEDAWEELLQEESEVPDDEEGGGQTPEIHMEDERKNGGIGA